MSKLMLFFDFDGTLSPIVKNPEEAFIPDKVRSWLERLSKNKEYIIAVVTGRSLQDIRKRVGLKNIIYASNHGMEVYYRGRFLLRKGDIYKRPLKNLEKELIRELSGTPNIYIENKGLSIAIHLRRVRKQYHAEVKRIVKMAVEPWLKRHKLQLTGGKMLLEVRPVLWDKGKAVLWMWKRFAPNHLPVYIGDDVTDEDAFRAIGDAGITVKVGRKATLAGFCLRNHKDVWAFLAALDRALRA